MGTANSELGGSMSTERWIIQMGISVAMAEGKTMAFGYDAVRLRCAAWLSPPLPSPSTKKIMATN